MPEFGPVLRKFRKAAGLSQEQLAAVSGVSVGAINTLENGRRRHPRWMTLRLLSQGLDLTEQQRAELVAAGTRTKIRAGTPQELPDDLADFDGRRQQVAELERVFTAGEERPGVVATSAIVGMGGVGKTALAVHVAHRLADRYPDGQLYLNLRGFGPGSPMPVAEALSRLMDSLGLQPFDDPAEVHEAAARYRSALAQRRVLVLLDNAADAAQVTPLLPGASTCAVLITSRRALTTLPGVAHVMLDVLPEEEAVRILEVIVGDDRIANDPDGAVSIVRLCGALPLALQIAGGRLADDPSRTVAELAAQLHSSRHRLDQLRTGDRDVRASIEFSLAAATGADTAAVAAFKLLGLHEGDELDVCVAAALLDLTVDEAEAHLERLVDLHLVESLGPRRYRLHDLVRNYVQETTAAATDPPYREAARLRVLRLYRAMAWRTRPVETIDALTADWSDGFRVPDADHLTVHEVLAWFDSEIEEVMSTIRRAADGSTALRAEVAELVVGLLQYLHHRRRYDDALALGATALAVEQDPYAAAILPFELAQLASASGLRTTALRYMTTALEAEKLAEYPEVHLEGRIFLAGFLAEVGRLDEAATLAGVAVDEALQRGTPFLEANGRLVLGLIAGLRGQPAIQDSEFRHAVELVSCDGDHNRRHMIAVLAGTSLREGGRFGAALAYYEACRVAALDGGSEFELAEALEGLGRSELGLGDLGNAEQHLRGALEIVQGTWQPEARVREQLGHVLLASSRRTEAEEEWQMTLDLLERHGSPQADDIRRLLKSDG